MNNNPIYTKTAKGFAELSRKSIHLPRHYYEILGAIDGHSNAQDLLGQMKEISPAEFEMILQHLCADGLVKILDSCLELELDSPLDSEISVSELDPEDGVRAWAEARRCAAELNKSGYFSAVVRSSESKHVIKILVVEDDPVMARMEIGLLQNAGFEPTHVASGMEMELALVSQRPDLITLDVMLPDTNGFVLLQWLRKHPDFGKLPIVMVTAQAGVEDVLCGLRGGADGYIFKPFRAEALIQCIRKVLNI